MAKNYRTAKLQYMKINQLHPKFKKKKRNPIPVKIFYTKVGYNTQKNIDKNDTFGNLFLGPNLHSHRNL